MTEVCGDINTRCETEEKQLKLIRYFISYHPAQSQEIWLPNHPSPGHQQADYNRTPLTNYIYRYLHILYLQVDHCIVSDVSIFIYVLCNN